MGRVYSSAIATADGAREAGLYLLHIPTATQPQLFQVVQNSSQTGSSSGLPCQTVTVTVTPSTSSPPASISVSSGTVQVRDVVVTCSVALVTGLLGVPSPITVTARTEVVVGTTSS